MRIKNTNGTPTGPVWAVSGHSAGFVVDGLNSHLFASEDAPEKSTLCKAGKREKLTPHAHAGFSSLPQNLPAKFPFCA